MAAGQLRGNFRPAKQPEHASLIGCWTQLVGIQPLVMSARHTPRSPTSFKQRLNWRGKRDMTVLQADRPTDARVGIVSRMPMDTDPMTPIGCDTTDTPDTEAEHLAEVRTTRRPSARRSGVDSKRAVRRRTVDHDRFLTKTNTTLGVWTARDGKRGVHGKEPPASLPELGEDGQRAGQRRLRH